MPHYQDTQMQDPQTKLDRATGAYGESHNNCGLYPLTAAKNKTIIGLQT